MGWTFDQGVEAFDWEEGASGLGGAFARGVGALGQGVAALGPEAAALDQDEAAFVQGEGTYVVVVA